MPIVVHVPARGDAGLAAAAGSTMRALYVYESGEIGRLSLTRGEDVCSLELSPTGWCRCRNVLGHEGWVPASYLELVPPRQVGPSPSAATPIHAGGTRVVASIVEAACWCGSSAHRRVGHRTCPLNTRAKGLSAAEVAGRALALAAAMAARKASSTRRPYPTKARRVLELGARAGVAAAMPAGASEVPSPTSAGTSASYPVLAHYVLWIYILLCCVNTHASMHSSGTWYVLRLLTLYWLTMSYGYIFHCAV